MVDFDTSMLSGTITHKVNVNTRTSKFILDTMKLTIEKAWLVTVDDKKKEKKKSLAFVNATPNEKVGSVVEIQFTEALEAGSQHVIQIQYHTSPDATGLNWLIAKQTETKKMPYLFSQCEPIYCRSIAPLQDTPSLKAPYSADITVENQFKVFMSANSTGKPVPVGKTHMKYSFDNQIPIPSYLMALAVGNLEYASVGRRTGVISEPGVMLDTTKQIYGDDKLGIENALDRMEDYLTPYIWGNYTLLVLPPTFPYGGMENPLLTFASPTTIMTNDTSQTYVATHEIAHSWTGNEVTCQDWSNMWLNEGFTVFEERKITGFQHGGEFEKVEMLLGTFDLADSFKTFGDKSTFSSLNPQFDGADPNASFSEVPYEKGF